MDSRGTTVEAPDLENGREERVWITPERSSRAEVPGQQSIDIVRIGVDPDVPDVTLWSRVRIDGVDYDLAAPPTPPYGSRHVRHYSLTLRRRNTKRAEA